MKYKSIYYFLLFFIILLSDLNCQNGRFIFLKPNLSFSYVINRSSGSQGYSGENIGVDAALSIFEISNDWWPGGSITLHSNWPFNELLAYPRSTKSFELFYQIPLGKWGSTWVETRRQGNYSFGYYCPPTTNKLRIYYRSYLQTDFKFQEVGLYFLFSTPIGGNTIGIKYIHSSSEISYYDENYYYHRIETGYLQGDIFVVYYEWNLSFLGISF